MINTQVIDPQELEMIHSKSSAIKCLALIDIVFSCFYIFASPFFALSTFICLVMSMIGYYGAKNLNIVQILCYNIYLILQNIFRIIVFGFYVTHPEYFGISEINSGAILVNLIVIMLNIYINYFVYSFYKVIKFYPQDFLTSLTVRPNIVVVHGEIA